MAELATGAVNTLLGVIRNEAERLGRVGGDVQFIQEEMESMNSFLAHLARTRGEQQDEQIRTWMNQVRILANDCNSCLDVYLYNRNPNLHRPRRGVTRYLWWGWAFWWLRELVATHHAAGQLRVLKERARDVGERRLRYGVKLNKVPPPGRRLSPSSPGPDDEDAGVVLTTAPSSTTAAAAGDDYEEDDDEAEDEEDDNDPAHVVVLSTTTTSLDDYFKRKLVDWIKQRKDDKQLEERSPDSTMVPSIAFVLPAGKHHDEFARQALEEAGRDFKWSVLVDVPAVHWDALPLRPKEILCYILLAMQELSEPHPAVSNPWFMFRRDISTYIKRKVLLQNIRPHDSSINKESVDPKFQEIWSQVKAVIDLDDKKQLQLLQDLQKFENLQGLSDKNTTDGLGKLLWVLICSTADVAEQDPSRKKAMRTLSACYDVIIKAAAEKLNAHLVGNHAGDSQQLLHPDVYRDILKEIFPNTHTSTATNTNTSVVDDQIKEMIDKAKEMIQDLQKYTSGMNRDTEEPSLQDSAAEKIEKIRVKIKKQLKMKMIVDEIKKILQPTRSSKNNSQAESSPSKDNLGSSKDDLGPESSSKNNSQAESSPKDSNLGPSKDNLGPESSSKNNLQAKSPPKDNLASSKDDLGHENSSKVNSQAESSSMNNLQADSSSTNNLEAEKMMIILKIDPKHVPIWEETKKALIQMEASRYLAGAAIVTMKNTKSIGQAAERYFSDPQLEVIEHSLVGKYFNIAQHTGRSMYKHEEKLKIVRNILEKCDQNEFCMSIFAHALKANPKRSTEDLHKLYRIMQARPTSPATIARKLLKFSYRDLPKQHKSCFLYLAIFPENYPIRQSTLIARWVAEGLITTEDWSWSSSVDEAEKCFRSLVDRKLVCPVDYNGATGRVKIFKVEPVVHRFILKIAMKQHIVEPRLPLELARHFSIFSDVRLRRSENIQTFLSQKIHALPQFSKLKVLDLEGCTFFANNRGYLKDICSKILMLKYLSLRKTDVDRLPYEINKLHELEVLDIRQTNIPASATRNVLLLKLKRLLAGRRIDPSPRNTGTGMAEDFSSVQIPEKIEKMADVEVLSNVKPRKRRDLGDIGELFQLKKLGIVINQGSHVQDLLQVLKDRMDQLQSLSITLDITKQQATSSKRNLPNPPESIPFPDLESLSISGSTQEVQLLPLLATEKCRSLAKVTLRSTSLKQEDLKVLATLPNLVCLRLWHGAYTDRNGELTFRKDELEFPKLKLLAVSSSEITKIFFHDGSPALEKIVLSSTGSSKITSFTNKSPELEEIVLSFTENKSLSLSGIHNLGQLKELELIGGAVSDVADEAFQKYCREKKLAYRRDKKPET